MKLDRWAPLSGVVFVVMMALSFVLIGETGDSDGEITAWYADKGNRTGQLVALLAVLVASLALVWFASTLRARLHKGENSFLASLGQGGAVAAAALWLAAMSSWAAIASSIEDSDDFVLDPDAFRAFQSLGELLFVAAGGMSALLVLATSVAALRAGGLPRWLAWLGIPIAVLLLATFVFIPYFIFLGWVLVVSIVLILKPTTETAALPAGG